MLNIGLVQMNAKPLKVNDNLSKAAHLISQAAKDGAELVVLPEMFNVGLSVEEELMKLGEPLGGNTVCWLKDQAVKNHIFITASFYEQKDGYFYNTMVMVGYDRSLQLYRKRNPTVQERLVWKRCDEPGPGIFETPFGRIGGAICFDSFSNETYEGFKQSGVDLIIIVALWGTFLPTIKYPDTFYFNKLLKYQSYLASKVVPQQYATQLTVPAVYVNQSGMINVPMAHPRFYPMPDWKSSKYYFVGNSNIYEPSGIPLIQRMDSKAEFCTVVPVEINRTKKRTEISRVNISPDYLNKDYYFVEPPFMFKLYQKMCFDGFKREYQARCSRNAR